MDSLESKDKRNSLDLSVSRFSDLSNIPALTYPQFAKLDHMEASQYMTALESLGADAHLNHLLHCMQSQRLWSWKELEQDLSDRIQEDRCVRHMKNLLIK